MSKRILVNSLHSQKIREAIHRKMQDPVFVDKLRSGQLGREPWNKGLTKETSIGVATYSASGSITRKEQCASGVTVSPWKKRWDNGEYGVGDKSPHWKGGRTLLYQRVFRSKEWTRWRDAIFRRDEFTCQRCGTVGGLLVPHHKIFFRILLDQYLDLHQELRQSIDLLPSILADDYFWQVDNGITLCRKCHGIIHEEERKLR